MSDPSVLVTLVLLAAGWHVIATLAIFHELQRRGRHPSFLLLRLYAPAYASEYRQLTRDETGRAGPLFYHWVLSINVAALSTVGLVIAAR